MRAHLTLIVPLFSLFVACSGKGGGADDDDDDGGSDSSGGGDDGGDTGPVEQDPCEEADWAQHVECLQPGELLWAMSFGESSYDEFFDVSAVPGGGAWTAGYAGGATTVHGTTVGPDGFFLQLDAAGTAVRGITVTWFSARTVAALDDGRVVLGGALSGTMDLGDTTLTGNGETSGWLAVVGETDTPDAYTVVDGFTFYDSAAVDDGSVCAVATGGGTGSWGGTSFAGTGMLVAQLSADMEPIWFELIEGSFVDAIGHPQIAGLDGGCAVAATFSGGDLDLGDGVTVTHNSGEDAMIAVFDGSGTAQWAGSVRGNDEQTAGGVAVTEGGLVVMTGQTAHPVYFDTTDGELSYSGWAETMYVQAWQSDGTPAWVAHATANTTDSGPSQGRDIAAAPGGGVLIGGYVDGIFELYDETDDETRFGGGNANPIFLRLDEGGQAEWIGRGEDDDGIGEVEAVSAGDDGAVYVAGRYYNGGMLFGAEEANETAIGESGRNGFLVTLAP